MVDIIKALIARFDGSAALKAALPGGLRIGHAREEEVLPARPYGFLQVPAGASLFCTEEDFWIDSPIIQVSIVGNTYAQAANAARIIATHKPDGFDRIREIAVVGGGTIVTMSRENSFIYLDDRAGPGGSRLWLATMDYRAQVSQGS